MNEEEAQSQAPQESAADPTQGFPTYQPPPPPPPGAGSAPRWAATPPKPKKGMRRKTVVALSVIGAVVVLAIAGVLLANPFAHNTVSAAPLAAGPDLRQGGVFVASNGAAGNVIAAFARNADGTLHEVGKFPTGGLGSGSFEDSSDGLVLGSSAGLITAETPNIPSDLLYAVNAGSGSVSVFKVERTSLSLVGQFSSAGQKPVSIAVHNGLVYVLNSGEFDNRLFLYNGRQPVGATENCTTGQLPSISGFHVDPSGHLTPIAGSTRLLSGIAYSGCAQVSISPDGTAVIVSERDAGNPPAGFPKGDLLVYPVKPDGSLGDPNIVTPTGNGPFGFTWADDHTVVVTEQNGGFVDTNGGEVSSYHWDGNTLQLTGISPAVRTTATDPCWIAVTAKGVSADGQVAYISGFEGTVSSFKLGTDGQLTLLHRTATAESDTATIQSDTVPEGGTDVRLSKDSKFLYVNNSEIGVVYAYRTVQNGTLIQVGKYPTFDVPSVPDGGQFDPFGMAAS